jgi:hypothetical protein
VDGHHERTSSRDLGEGTAAELHDLSGTSVDVVGASTKSLTAGGGSVTAEAGGVLLEGVAVGTVAGSGGNNTDGRAGTASITNCLDDGTVASHEGGGGQKAEGNNGGLGEVHFERFENSLNQSDGIKNR